jgi:DGQHR domain-containing protein
MKSRASVIRRPALKVDQDPRHPLYLFALTGEELLRVADIARVARDRGGKLVGYQRPSVARHIRNIADYLDSDEVLFPNSLILALSGTTTFVGSGHRVRANGFVTPGTITIRVSRNGGPKPAWIVDGQQRALALARSRRKDFPVAVNAFVADDVGLHREQFLRVNSTRPLPRGLITELLPEVSTVLPANLAIRRAPSRLCDLLCQDSASPFHGLIRRSSTPSGQRRAAVVADTAVIRMLQETLTSPTGCLFSYRNLATGDLDVDGARELLLTYWSAVRDTFPEAWGLPPTQSRLMHSAGIRAMGRLMDRVTGVAEDGARRTGKAVMRELSRIRPFCRWTAGAWEDLGGLRWNEIQNVPAHIRLLSNFLIRCYYVTANSR